MTTLKTDFPVLIKKMRSSLGLSQEKLAQRLGVSFQTVNRWERGKNLPSFKALELLEQQLEELEEAGQFREFFDRLGAFQEHRVSGGRS